MVILDTNVWVAALNIEDSLHEKAQKIFELCKQEVLGLPEYVYVETVQVLHRRAGVALSKQFVFMINDTKGVEMLDTDAELRKNIDTLYIESSNTLSFTDCSLLYLSKTYQVITFDKQLDNKIKQHS
jgi:predicted nucleic acid-binding protein